MNLRNTIAGWSIKIIYPAGLILIVTSCVTHWNVL